MRRQKDKDLPLLQLYYLLNKKMGKYLPLPHLNPLLNQERKQTTSAPMGKYPKGVGGSARQRIADPSPNLSQGEETFCHPEFISGSFQLVTLTNVKTRDISDAERGKLKFSMTHY